ncbi:hypothetical protein D3C71_1578720 [compost metagenome]
MQFAHGAQADGRGGIIQPQTVGGEVQRDQADGRMVARDLGHQASKQRAQHVGQFFDQAGAFGDAQKAQPQGQRAEKQHHHFHGDARHVEQAGHHQAEDLGVSDGQPAVQRGYGSGEEEAQPEFVQHADVPGQRLIAHQRGDAHCRRVGTPRLGRGPPILVLWPDTP